MKKFGLLIISILVMMVSFKVKAYELPEKTDHEKVTIYLFRGDGCPHCYDALEYFLNHNDEFKDYINIVTYEVWNNEANHNFFVDFLKSQDIKVSNDGPGVPHIVIGTSYNEAGFQNYMAEDIMNAAFLEYQNEDYKDIVADFAKDYKVNSTTLNEAWEEENTQEEQKSNPRDTIIAIGIIAVVVVGGIILIKKSK